MKITLELNYLNTGNVRLILILGLLILFYPSCTQNRSGIRLAVKEMMHDHPESSLQDLYKSFFQDRMGPGHLIRNPEMAKNYILKEIAQADSYEDLKLELTGAEGNFYRVNLSLLADSIIPLDSFMIYFVKSVNGLEAISLEDWKNEWKLIAREINAVCPDLPGFDKDLASIDSLLGSGSYVGHHSRAYLDAYQPLYRLVRRDLFEQHLRIYLNGEQAP